MSEVNDPIIQLIEEYLSGVKSSGSSYNAADAEANQEMVDILRRRKKVKRKRGVGF